MIDLKGYGHFFIDGLWMTIGVALVSMAAAIAMGLVGAGGKLSRNKTARTLANIYTVVIRGVPDLILLLLLYYNGTVFLNGALAAFGYTEHVDINPFVTGVLVLGFIYGAFATETFRGAFLAVPHGQVEAARACGMSRWLVFRRVQLPQMWRFALPGLGNIWLVLLKGTSIITVVGLQELTNKSQQANGVLKMPFTVFFLASLIYLTMTAVSNLALHTAERRASAGVRRD